MCSLTVERVLLLPHTPSRRQSHSVRTFYYMCSLTVECVLLLPHIYYYTHRVADNLIPSAEVVLLRVFSSCRMCSLSMCALLLQHTPSRRQSHSIRGGCHHCAETRRSETPHSSLFALQLPIFLKEKEKI